MAEDEGRGGDGVAELTQAGRRVWPVLETDSASRADDDAGRWVSVYTHLLSLLDKGAAVSVGDRGGNDLVGLGRDEVCERLDFWRSRLDPSRPSRSAGTAPPKTSP